MPSFSLPIPRNHITGLVLAGGQGSRMGGVDKGLQMLAGQSLAHWCVQRLAPQVGGVLINANRNADTYAALGYPLVADMTIDNTEAFPGPMAGFAAGLAACTTPWLLTVACDTPFFPMNLAERLSQAVAGQQTPAAMACTRDASADGHKRLPQPTFCLLHTSLAASAQQYLAQGGRKVRQWTAQHAAALVVFDDPQAFFNANTLQDVAALESFVPSR